MVSSVCLDSAKSSICFNKTSSSVYEKKTLFKLMSLFAGIGATTGTLNLAACTAASFNDGISKGPKMALYSSNCSPCNICLVLTKSN